MPIAESLYFVYDGVSSMDMGLININLTEGLAEETFLPEQIINEVAIRGRNEPYFIETKKSPIKLNLSFAFEQEFDDERLQDVARWLGSQPYYKPLYFSDNPDKWYYALYSGEVRLTHNTLKQGYITLEMRNISAYTYSPVYSTAIYDFSVNPAEGTELVFLNRGNQICKPLMYIEKIGAGEVKICNHSNSSNTFRIANLADGEQIEVNCKSESIDTNLPLTYRYDDVYGDYPAFVYGDNYLRIYGNCRLSIKYQYSS